MESYELRTILFYLLIFMFSAIFLVRIQKRINHGSNIIIVGGHTLFSKRINIVVYGMACLFPTIIVYGLRVGIGTDYYSYLETYNTLHDASLSTYWTYHLENRRIYYQEIGFYILNRIVPNFRLLLFVEGIIIYSVLLKALADYRYELNMGFAIFIYMATQFTYSTNGIRYSIALAFALLGYKYLAENKNIHFFVCVFLAFLFHKTALFCIIIYFMKEFKNKSLNKVRDFMLGTGILLFPLLSRWAMEAASLLPIFRRYFSTTVYSASETMNWGWKWLMHIIPVIVPLFLIAKRYIVFSSKNRILLRIYLMEAPLRMLGLYNTWYTRFARYGQIVVVLLIPLVVSQIENKRKKQLLTIFYIAWYIFYFYYYAAFNDAGDTIPYVWIFSGRGK